VFRTFLLAASFAGLAIGQAVAQTNAAAKPNPPSQPVSSEPEATTATYGAWTLRCTHRQAGGATTRFCEVEQAVVPQGQQNPIAQIGVGRLSPKEEMRLTVVLPTNIAFRNAPKVTAQDKDPGVALTWERCVPGGCIADAALKDDVLRTWHAIAADTGRLLFTNAAGQNVAIEFSFRGFGQAMDAFAKARA
jgi:invasion protein IalB